jgi:hypothetical protein
MFSKRQTHKRRVGLEWNRELLGVLRDVVCNPLPMDGPVFAKKVVTMSRHLDTTMARLSEKARSPGKLRTRHKEPRHSCRGANSVFVATGMSLLLISPRRLTETSPIDP